MSITIRIGTRGSELALWQANHVATQLRAHGHDVALEIIRTVGDRMQDPAYLEMVRNAGSSGSRQDPAFVAPDGLSPNGTGIFIKEIEEALITGRIDLAVHSLKDLPTTSDERLALAAIPPRADARDAFVCEDHWGLHMLPTGARIGTTSPRRKAMVLALRPDITFVELRGNVDTRLRKWREGQADALILASAGLDRLTRTENVHQRFSVDEICPAPGQGALALQTRCPLHPLDTEDPTRDPAIHAAVRALNDPDTEYATQAERTVLHTLGGGCQLPLGAYCHQSGNEWHLHAMVAAPDGDQVAHIIERAPLDAPACELGTRAAEALKARGALELLDPQPVA